MKYLITNERHYSHGKVVVYQIIPLNSDPLTPSPFITSDSCEADNYRNCRDFVVEEVLEDRLPEIDTRSNAPFFERVYLAMKQYFLRRKRHADNLPKA